MHTGTAATLQKQMLTAKVIQHTQATETYGQE